MEFRAFGKQSEYLESTKEINGVFAGKRGGKTEAFIVKDLMLAHARPGWVDNGRDPWTSFIVEPTAEMVRKILVPKFDAFTKGMLKYKNDTLRQYVLKNDSVIYLCSGDKPIRMEGVKASHFVIDEAFQQKESLYLEALARTSDSEGAVVDVGGSLSPGIVNPKNTWVWEHFKKNPSPDIGVFEWATLDNPHFPKKRLERLKGLLDKRTLDLMFSITWDIMPSHRVYDEFDEESILDNYEYDPKLPTYVSIDWGWTHPMACLFWQHDPRKDTLYLFDEIVQSKLKLEKLHKMILDRNYNVTEWYCDVAGKQTREQTGISNIHWFSTKGIHFKYRATAISYGIPILRSYIKNSRGIRRLYVARSCSKSIDSFVNYSYKEKDGDIVDENPVKEDDDAVDSARYLMVNRFDPRVTEGEEFNEFSRWRRK